MRSTAVDRILDLEATWCFVWNLHGGTQSDESAPETAIAALKGWLTQLITKLYQSVKATKASGT